MTLAWVIGSTGLLGSAVTRSIAHRPAWRLLDAPRISWDSPIDVLARDAEATAAALVAAADRDAEPWSVIWTAGKGVTSSREDQFDDEYARLEAILGAVSRHARGSTTRGSLFFASSAGGVYAGSRGAPFSEHTTPVPISPYGRFKLRAEQLVTATASEAGIPSLVGRISNLYGPGQRLDKPQGLISHIALARLTARPASIYVSLDTLRDYLYVDDCARLILDGLERLEQVGGNVTKILASGQSVSVAGLIGQFRTITGGRPRIVLGASEAGALQARDLRLRSVVWPELDRGGSTGLPAGINATMIDILAAVQRGAA